MKHKVITVENLTGKNCEIHYCCVVCSSAVPQHCYKKEEFENMECRGINDILTIPIPKKYKRKVEQLRKKIKHLQELANEIDEVVIEE